MELGLNKHTADIFLYIWKLKILLRIKFEFVISVKTA